MSLAASAVLAAAERVERAGGPGAGLAVWRRLAANAADKPLRARAVLSGLRCATTLGDPEAVVELSSLWESVDEGDYPEVFGFVKDLWRVGHRALATELARVETRRFRSSRALYAYARCLDAANDARAEDAFAQALERAEREGAAAYVRACKLRRAARLARRSDTLPEALDIARGVDLAGASDEERIALARILLRSPSRFARSSALGLLDDVVRVGAAVLRGRALQLAARHADDMGDALTPMEADRLLALFGREPIAKDAARAREALRLGIQLAHAVDADAFASALSEATKIASDLAPLHQRARDVLGGRFEPHLAPLSSNPPDAWTTLLDGVVALRDRAWPRLVRVLVGASERVESSERVPAAFWTMAEESLAADDLDVQMAGARLATALVERSNGQTRSDLPRSSGNASRVVHPLPAPPRGWSRMARALASAGLEDLAMSMRRRAALAREAGAGDILALALAREGWTLAASGERLSAIARLREARAVSEMSRGTPSAPSAPPVPASLGASGPSDGEGTAKAGGG